MAPKTIPDPATIAKLPKWAQEYISDLERQRDVSMRALQEYQDEQTVQPISQLNTTPAKGGGTDFRRRYIHGHSISIKWLGVDMDITLTPEDGIRISFSSEHRALSGGAAILPQSGNCILIKEVEFTKPAPGQKGR